MQDTRRDLPKNGFPVFGILLTLYLLHFKSAFPVSDQAFEVADSRSGSCCSNTTNPVKFLEGWSWSVHTL